MRNIYEIGFDYAKTICATRGCTNVKCEWFLFCQIKVLYKQGFRLRVRRERKNMQKRRIKRGGLEKW